MPQPPTKCKKCVGTGEHRRGQKCAACRGSGWVALTTDGDGRTVVTPAVKP